MSDESDLSSTQREADTWALLLWTRPGGGQTPGSDQYTGPDMTRADGHVTQREGNAERKGSQIHTMKNISRDTRFLPPDEPSLMHSKGTTEIRYLHISLASYHLLLTVFRVAILVLTIGHPASG